MRGEKSCSTGILRPSTWLMGHAILCQLNDSFDISLLLFVSLMMKVVTRIKSNTWTFIYSRKNMPFFPRVSQSTVSVERACDEIFKVHVIVATNEFEGKASKYHETNWFHKRQ
jgi:hypothetical protein